MSNEKTIKSGEWEQWFPSGLISKKRPAGIIAIYKISGLLRIFKDSFSDLKEDLGFVKIGESWKFITVYSSKAKLVPGLPLRKQCLGFRLHLEKVEGTLNLSACADGGFSVSLKQVLPNFDYKGFLDGTRYFEVKYDMVNKLHYIEFGKPDYEYKKGKGFYPYGKGRKK